ncbi:Tolloid-like protein 1 [Exaiptasia diaphana]|nr:Tolloid-like protein 1 [Exaiptasia diaphana]
MNCRYDYVEIRDEKNELLAKLCGSNIPKTVTSPSNIMFVEFKSDHTQSRKGFSAMYYADEDECQENKGGCHHICVNTIGSYRCECKVGYALHHDQRRCKEASECGATLKTLSGVVSSPNFPGVYQHKKDCTWKIIVTPGSHIRLTYRFLQIEEANDCRYDYVEIFSGTGINAESLGRACGNLIPKPVVSKSYKMLIKFHSDALIAKRGFKARYETYCGAELHASNQKRIFYSHPAYGDDNYSPSLKCTWKIASRSGYIKLRFKEFDLENEKFCSYDEVIIRDGNNTTSPLLGKACGNKKTPKEFFSTGNQLFVQFTTDLTTQKKGFIAEYSRVKSKKEKNKKYKTKKNT